MFSSLKLIRDIQACGRSIQHLTKSVTITQSYFLYKKKILVAGL